MLTQSLTGSQTDITDIQMLRERDRGRGEESERERELNQIHKPLWCTTNWLVVRNAGQSVSGSNPIEIMWTLTGCYLGL